VNFTQGGYNIEANGARNGACVVKTVIAGVTVASTCTQSVFDKGPCEDNAGVWWGPGYTDPSVLPGGHPPDVGYRSCWQVNQSEYKANVPLTPISPEISIAVRNDSYKVVRNTIQTYDATADTGGPVTTDEFYQINQDIPTPLIDKAALNLIPTRSSWAPALTTNYGQLSAELDTILASQPACPGDGNIDGRVDALDVGDWMTITQTWGLSSVFDVNLDGATDLADLAIIRKNQGLCAKTSAVF
jgi:hypothetical protein